MKKQSGLSGQLEQEKNNLSRRNILKGASILGLGLISQVWQPLAFANSNAHDLDEGKSFGQVHTQTRVMLGTFVTISAVHKNKNLAEEAISKAFKHMQSLESEFTRHKASPLTTLNETGKLLSASPHLIYVLQKAKQVHNLTSGAFDVTIAPLLQLYRQGQNPNGNMRLDAKEVQAAKELMQADQIHLSHDHIRLGRSSMMLTLDGIAKGYIADEASKMLTQHGIVNHLVNAGGDIVAKGQKAQNTAWHVGIESPAKNNTTIAKRALSGAIATSGNYENYYDAQKKYHHLINAHSKQSAKHLISASVIAPTALEADALATAISTMQAKDALILINSLPRRECLLIDHRGSIFTSRNWG